MGIRVVPGDILDSGAEALFVTAAPEPPRKGARATEVLGGLGGHLLRRIGPEADEDLSQQLDIPVRPGTVQILDLTPGCGIAFQRIFVLGALGHTNDSPHRQLMTAALKEAFQLARAEGVRRIALNLPRGGWRIDAVSAAYLLLDALAGHADFEIDVYCGKPEDLPLVSGILR